MCVEVCVCVKELSGRVDRCDRLSEISWCVMHIVADVCQRSIRIASGQILLNELVLSVLHLRERLSNMKRTVVERDTKRSGKRSRRSYAIYASQVIRVLVHMICCAHCRSLRRRR